MASYDYRDPRSPASIDEPPPQVAIAGRSWVVPVMVLAALGLGALVFLQLSQGRVRLEQARLTDPSPAAAPAINSADLPAPAPLPAPPIAPPVEEPAIAPPQFPAPTAIDPAREAEIAARLKAPSLVVDLSEATPPPGAAPTPGAALSPQAVMRAAAPSGASDRRGESDERFAADIRGEGAIKAERLAHPAATVIEGTMLAAVLETAINSDLPGLARAVVSRDVRSFDGTQVLIPRGSRVIGQYKSGVALGQSRAFVIWTRLIRPDGVSLPLAAPATDEMGRGGLQSKVDRHFLRRFGGAILLSLISAGANAATDSSDTQIIIAGARGSADAASIALQKEIDLPPTLSVPQGQPIRIFVSRDLDFSSIDALP
jgi:type IV secretory pathway VirB10-like protein